MNEISNAALTTRRGVTLTLAISLALPAVACGGQKATDLESLPRGETGYGWQLPLANPTGPASDGEIYSALRTSCDDGERALTQRWAEASGPRTVLLFAAGVELCRGHVDQARIYYSRARSEYGWDGLGPAQDGARCDVYKSVASVMEQAPREQFECRGGANPDFKRSTSGAVDNPLTSEDESAASTSSAGNPTVAGGNAAPRAAVGAGTGTAIGADAGRAGGKTNTAGLATASDKARPPKAGNPGSGVTPPKVGNPPKAGNPPVGEDPPMAGDPGGGAAPPKGGNPPKGGSPPKGENPPKGGSPPMGQDPVGGVAPPKGKNPPMGGDPPMGQDPVGGVPPPKGKKPPMGGNPPMGQDPVGGVPPPKGKNPPMGDDSPKAEDPPKSEN